MQTSESASQAPARMVLGPWEGNVSPEVERAPHSAVEHGQELLRQWQRHFPLANTWVGKEYGVPSLIVRIDGVLKDGMWQVFEVEERPCGIGITAGINPHFAALLRELMVSYYPPIRWVKSELRQTDDELWFGPGLTLEEALVSTDTKFLVRSRPEETAYHALEDRSVSSVSEEGNKSYGVSMGLWDCITVREDGDEHVFDPPITEACVLKPLVGTRARHVKAYYPTNEQKQRTGLVSHRKGDFDSVRQLARLVLNQPERKMYRQPFIHPMRFAHQPDRGGMYRFYYAYQPKGKFWLPLGGVWMALDSVIIHGTERTITGALVH